MRFPPVVLAVALLSAGCASERSQPSLSSADAETDTPAEEAFDSRQAAREAVFGSGASAEGAEGTESAGAAPAAGAESSGGASSRASSGEAADKAAGERQVASAAPVPASFYFRQSFAAGLDGNRDPRVPTGKIVAARAIEIEDGKTQCTPLEIGSAAGFAALGPPGMLLAMAITKLVAPHSVPAAEYAVTLDDGRTITLVRRLEEDEAPLAEGLDVVVALDGAHPALIPAAAYVAPEAERDELSIDRLRSSVFDRRRQTTPLF